MASTTSTTASSIPAPGCVTRRRCSAPMSKACGMSLMSPSRNPACTSSSSPAHIRRWVGGTGTWRPKRTRSPPRGLTPYVQSRVQAENLVMRYVAEADLPAVAMCVSTTYGSGDWGRTPHGAFIAGAVFGKLPFMMDGIQLEVVGVDDAARAMILAAERGRIGERYLVSERMIGLKEVVRIAADEAGVPPPQRVDFGADAVRPGCVRHPEGPVHRQRCRTQSRVGADDARRSRRRQQQGAPRTGLAAAPGRGIDPRGRPVLGGDARRSIAETAFRAWFVVTGICSQSGRRPRRLARRIA